MHVARLRSVKRLTIRSAQDLTYPHPPDSLSEPSFPVLGYLFIGCETVRFCASLVQAISSPNFETLCIRPLTNWSTSAWQELHTTLRDCLNNAVFKSIEVDQGDERSRPTDTASYVLSSDALRPLLAMKNLTSISYQIHPGLDVGDGFLKEMALAWPGLQTLYFGTEVLITEVPQATLGCLIPFAQHCPDLSSLGVRMNALEVPEFIQVPGDRIDNWLNALEVGSSPINSEKDAHVAAFISNLFPQLEYVIPFNSPPIPGVFGSYAKSWNRVEKMVPVFSSVRSQEEDFWTEENEETEEAMDDAEEN